MCNFIRLMALLIVAIPLMATPTMAENCSVTVTDYATVDCIDNRIYISADTYEEEEEVKDLLAGMEFCKCTDGTILFSPTPIDNDDGN